MSWRITEFIFKQALIIDPVRMRDQDGFCIAVGPSKILCLEDDLRGIAQ